MKNDNTQYTPTPWKYTKIQAGIYEIESTNPRLCTVAMAEFLPHYDAEAAANARRIVAAVNAYDRLRAENERLRDALQKIGTDNNAVRLLLECREIHLNGNVYEAAEAALEFVREEARAALSETEK